MLESAEMGRWLQLEGRGSMERLLNAFPDTREDGTERGRY
jgi:hypothetical protein